MPVRAPCASPALERFDYVGSMRWIRQPPNRRIEGGVSSQRALLTASVGDGPLRPRLHSGRPSIADDPTDVF
jgi:hypothetical protein